MAPTSKPFSEASRGSERFFYVYRFISLRMQNNPL
ncbi:MAG: hypothetical protein ACI9EB_000240 [Pseudomonas sp.]|jgi:hypothetical protein